MAIHYRESEPSDFDAIHKLILEHVTYDASNLKEHTRQYMRLYNLVAVDEGNIIGFSVLGILKDDRKKYEPLTMSSGLTVVHPDYQGRGIGRNLIKLKLAHVPLGMMVIVSSWIKPDMTNGVNSNTIYRKLGFTPIEYKKEHCDPIGNGESSLYIRCRFYCKDRGCRCAKETLMKQY